MILKKHYLIAIIFLTLIATSCSKDDNYLAPEQEETDDVPVEDDTFVLTPEETRSIHG